MHRQHRELWMESFWVCSKLMKAMSSRIGNFPREGRFLDQMYELYI